MWKIHRKNIKTALIVEKLAYYLNEFLSSKSLDTFFSTALPTTSKNWGKIKVTIKQYLQDLLQV